jgi:hypothetical protein
VWVKKRVSFWFVDLGKELFRKCRVMAPLHILQGTGERGVTPCCRQACECSGYVVTADGDVAIFRPAHTQMELTSLTYSTEHSPSWKGYNSWAGQEIPCFLCNPIHNKLPLVTNLSQINPLHASPFIFLKIHFNITVHTYYLYLYMITLVWDEN